jgi:hypothetical protein
MAAELFTTVCSTSQNTSRKLLLSLAAYGWIGTTSLQSMWRYPAIGVGGEKTLIWHLNMKADTCSNADSELWHRVVL